MAMQAVPRRRSGWSRLSTAIRAGEYRFFSPCGTRKTMELNTSR